MTKYVTNALQSLTPLLDPAFDDFREETIRLVTSDLESMQRAGWPRSAAVAYFKLTEEFGCNDASGISEEQALREMSRLINLHGSFRGRPPKD